MKTDGTLQVEGLTKTFGKKIATDSLSLKMERPGVFGLIGTNGAGKTTAIRCILGIMTPDKGTSLWQGKKISRETLSFGYMPEERGLYMKEKVLEQLVYFAMLRGMARTDAKKSAESYLSRLKISEYKDTIVEKLSKGNQQKVQFVSTLVHNPDLIFLDEPFSGIDPINTEIIRGLIGELVDEGRYIVMSSHQMNVVEEYCRDIVLLHRGKTILSGDLKEIKAGYGHTNLIISAPEDLSDIAKRQGLKVIENRIDETEYAITGDAMANGFLREMLTKGTYPTKFQVKEPSLHEIFIEKVGAQL